MKIILISDNGRRHKKLSINIIQHLLLPFIAILLIGLVSVFVDNYFQNSRLSKSESELLSGLDSMLQKIAVLDAEIQRLNMLGSSIANNENMDISSFHLQNAPALGGSSNPYYDGNNSRIVTETDLLKEITAIESRLSRQKVRFTYIRELSEIKKKLQQYKGRGEGQKIPNNFSTPVSKGYISSDYGKRRDPINGHQRHHNGVDIAAKKGTQIHAIASGFVTFSGKKGGYGNVVEVHHTDSLKSRYAHLNRIDVKKGDVVRKGTTIATMGSTGRSTGSHLHLEVWKGDAPEDPGKFINLAIFN